MIRFCEASIEALIDPKGYDCACGRHHQMDMDYIKIGSGAIASIPEGLAAMGAKRPFIVCDVNTKKAAWDKVKPVLDAANIEYTFFCFPMEQVEPDEHAMGSMVLAFDPACDCVLGIGSGVINDSCKVLAHAMGRKQMIVGTAPSMDGYASSSSSMVINGCKVSLINACPAAIICDIDIIKDAPMRMLHAGLGDMLAKYIGLCEWRIVELINGEYRCENVAALMRASVDKIVANAPGLRRREPAAVQATVEGLVLSGIAMSYAGSSRPASGLEHYFSHLWEMMALERGVPYELHGIQVGVGTLLGLRVYDQIRTMTPDREKALAFVQNFDTARWEGEMRRIFGSAGDELIRQEYETLHNNDKAAHAERLERIIAHWDDIQRIIREELPETEKIVALMREVEAPMVPADIAINNQDTNDAFHYARNTRNKYLTSSMLWDLGLLYDMTL
ncbi:MAG: sn-glycerol-1-phosphate dehydrogenase [Clostridiales bacterium]|nr:sn-glycerol-1-phosphate dehydrogenase [Clostridiales bacterium]